MEVNASLLVIVGIFWITYWILRIFFFRPLTRILDGRRELVESSQAAFDKARGEADARLDRERERLAEARVEAGSRRERRRREAEEARQRLLAEARAEAQSRIDQAQRELSDELARQRQTLSGRASQLAEQMAERLLGRAV